MADSLKIDERRKKILEYLNRDGMVRVSMLSKELNATTVTIRNDLATLEQNGFLQRTNGGAILTVKNVYKLDFLHRRQTNLEQKRKIAQKAASMIHDWDTIMINSGTTTFLTAVELKKRKNLNIVTNSLEIALELGQQPTFKVILLGGETNAQYAFTYGNDALDQLKHYKADFAILSMDGLCSDIGLTTFHAEEAVVDRTMIERSRKTMIVADSSKLNHEGFSFVADIDEISHLVTDDGATQETLEAIRRKDVEVVLADIRKTSEGRHIT